MKSVADLIANKNARIKRDKRGKITAASLTAAGAAVLAAAQAEAQSVDGFEDITSSVISFERIGNGQVEFELENGQRFIANEGQYIIEGNQILVSQELVTIVGGAGINPTVIAVGVAGAALVVGALILMNSDDDDDATTTTTTTTTPTTPTFTITSDSATAATGTDSADAFSVTNQTYSPGLTIDGGAGNDEVTLNGAATQASGIDLSSQNIQMTSIESLVVSANGGTSGQTATVNVAGEISSLTVEVTGDGDIDVDNLGIAGATAATAHFNNLDAAQTADVTFSNDVVKGTIGLNSAGTAGSGAANLNVSGAALTELTIASNTAANKVEFTGITGSVTKLVVTGSADLDISGNDVGGTGSTGVAEIDASNASGKLSFDFDPNVVGTISLGSNSDTITGITSNFNGGTLDGGQGGDTLVLNNISVSAGTITDIETVNLTSAGIATIDYSVFDSDLTDLNINATSTITIEGFDSGNIDIESTAANLSFTNNSSTTSVDIDAPNITGTLELTSSGTLNDVDVDFTGAGGPATLVTNAAITSVTIRAGASTSVTYSIAAAATDIDASNALGGIDFTSAVTGTIRGSSIADSFDFTNGNVTLDVNSLSELGDGYAATPSVGNNIVAAITASAIESISGFTASDELDFDGVFGDSTNISLGTQISATALTAADFSTAAAEIAGNPVLNAVFLDDTDGGNDYLLLENGGDIYVIEFTGGYNAGGGGTASPTVDDLFL